MSGWLALGFVVLMIAANGAFVAAEFALVSVRRGAIEERAAAGERRARLALAEIRNISFMLSAAQLGITASSLLVGFFIDEGVADVVIRPVLTLFGLPEATVVPVSAAIAFALATAVQMLFGELAPKNLAISRPEAVSLATAGFMHAFGRVFGPIITVFDRAAVFVSERIFRVPATEELLGGHTVEELARIIAASAQEGALSEAQSALAARAVVLGDTRVSEIMVPRVDVDWLPGDATLTDLLDAGRRTGHSRFPVCGDGEDDVLGSVHVKDVLATPPDQRGTTTLAETVTPVLVVPESEPVRRLLGQLRRQQRTFAIVVDEFGGTAGMVTLEDVLEELVGEIEDEFDRAVVDVQRLSGGRYRVSGTLRADRFDRLTGVELPEGDYETVAGFVIDRLGRIPDPGDAVEHAGWTLTVARVDGVRVTEVTVAPPPAAGPATGSDERQGSLR